MSRRGENIRKRTDGRWEGRYKIGIKENGKSIYKSVYAKTYTECKEKLEYNKFTLQSEKFSHSINFASAMKLWLDTNRIRLKGSTLCKYQYMIDTHISPSLGSTKINQLNSSVINNFLNFKLKNGSKQDKPLSPSYVKTIAIIIEATLKFAASEGWCNNLKSPVYKPTIIKRDVSILSKEQEIALNNCILNNTTPVGFGTYLALHTGMRIGELCALKWEDIDLENDIIYIKRTVSRVNNNLKGTTLILDEPKTISSRRQIPISSALKPVILKNYKFGTHEFIISSNNSGFINPRTFEYQFKKMLKSNNLEIFNFHTLRHTFATRCVESGVDIKTLSEILGHANVTTTLNTYVHTSIANKRAQIEKLYLSDNYGINMVTPDRFA